MKRVIRTPWVQSTIAWFASLYLRVTIATIRWRIEGRAAFDAAVSDPEGFVACFWHSRIGLAVVCRRLLNGKPVRVLISRSPDGEFITKTIGWLGVTAIRGTAALTDKRRVRSGARTFRGALRFLEEGGVVAITPDGPRGPAEVMPAGPALLARLGKAKALSVGLAVSPAITLGTWDRTKIPLPFSRGALVFDGPALLACGEDDDALEAARAAWQAGLDAAQARAEAMLAAR
ncbi:MAG TPA: lysophospholipid acyltransferase family protein [Caulobacteraceae bacterium]